MTNPGISAILLSWKRPDNVHAIIESLSACSQVKEIIVWNNNPAECFEPRSSFANIKVLQSSHNFLCPARYALPYIASCDTILFNDDDILVGPEQISDLYRRAAAHRHIITGIRGRDLRDGKYCPEDIYGRCDIILGQFMIFHKSLLATVYQRLLMLGPHLRGDDIAFSLLCNRKHEAVRVPFDDLGMDDDNALWRQQDHFAMRQQMVDRIEEMRRGERMLDRMIRGATRRFRA